jgi:glycosyltransferase involved in cell wall biosynthesis
LYDLIGDDVTHVYLVPWIMIGGADLELLNTIVALTELIPDARIAVIATQDVNSVWKNRLPGSVRFVEFGRNYGYLPMDRQELLLTRLLLQLAPNVVHNINSKLGYRIFSKYGAALADVSRLYASSFCGDRSPEGRMAGYPFGLLNDCFDFLTGVISDNQAHVDELIRIYGMEREKFICQYHPAPKMIDSKHFDEATLPKARLDVLWAGRIDRQKRPDILIAVADACRDLPFTFHAFGSSVLDADQFTKRFRAMDNLIFYGPFDGLTSLDANKFDVFLNTSQWDGLPNILLEAMSMGLPVVSSAVGGIPELIHDRVTGFLVSPFDDVSAYRKILFHLYENMEVLNTTKSAAANFIAERHGWPAFIESFKKIPGYLAVERRVPMMFGCERSEMEQVKKYACKNKS